MSWENVTITKVGEQLLSKMMNGSKLIFTRVVVGDKTVNNELLSAQTSVFSPISAPAMIAGKSETPEENGTQIKIQIRNDGVSETTRMRQVGLYAKSEHDDEVMLGILQDEIGEEIPAYDDFPQFLIELYAVIGISRTNNIQVVVDPSIYLTAADLQEFREEIANGLMPKDLPQKVETVAGKADEAAGIAEQALETANEVKQQLENLNVSTIMHKGIVIPADGWIQSDPEEYNGLSVDVPVEGVTEDMIPIVALSPKEGKRACKCEMYPSIKSGNGYIRFYAKASPSEPISTSATLLSVSGGTAGVGVGMLPATSDRLGGVKIGENINVEADGRISVDKQSLAEDITPSLEQTNQMLDEIFNK